MFINWKLALDVFFVQSIIGALLFIKLVEQKEEYVCINLALLSVLCLLYLSYFKSVRKRDLASWSEESGSSERPCITRMKRELRYFFNAGLPDWALIYLNCVINIIYLLFPGFLLLVNATSFTQNIIYILLGICSVLYVACLKQCVSDLKLRFRVQIHGGSQLILIGLFLICWNYGIFEHYIGVVLIFTGLNLYYDICIEYLSGVKLTIDYEAVPVNNGNASGRLQSSVSFFKRVYRNLLHTLV